MSFIQYLADKLFIQPTRHPVDAEHRTSKFVPLNGNQLQIWCQQFGEKQEPDVLVLKFIGAGGRAERSGPHPVETWEKINAQIWSVNPPGYGASSGIASVQNFPDMALAAYDAITKEHPGKKVLVVGNSIGSAPALYLATERPVDGLFLRNPPPIRPLVIGRYSWWNFGLGSRIIAKRFPEKLDSIVNAEKINAPALFVMSMKDTLVPVKYQQSIIDAFAGPKKTFQAIGANHDDPPDESQLDEYIEHLKWLEKQCMQRGK